MVKASIFIITRIMALALGFQLLKSPIKDTD